MGIGQQVVTPLWHGSLSNYVTGIAWSPQGQILAVTSAAGEIRVWRRDSHAWFPLMVAKDQTLDWSGVFG